MDCHSPRCPAHDPHLLRDVPLRHRTPGAVGAALALAGFVAEVLADEVHAHPAGVHALIRLAALVSRNPAAAAGVLDRTGRLVPGMDADLVVLDEQDRVVRTLVEGRTVYDAADSDRNPSQGDRGSP